MRKRLKAGILLFFSSQILGFAANAARAKACPSAPPLPPSGLSVQSKSASTVDLTWQASRSTNITGYLIYRNRTQIANVPSKTRSVKDSGLLPSTTYTYEVSAKNSCNILSGPVSINVTTMALQETSAGQSQTVAVASAGIDFPANSPAGTLFSTPFRSKVDPNTGNLIYQVSPFNGENHGFYYHIDSTVDGENAFVYRNLSSPSATTLVYLKVDLDKQTTLQLVPVGVANNGVVRGKWLYVVRTDQVGAGANFISRYHVDNPSQREDLLYTSERNMGQIAVNSNGTSMIYALLQANGKQDIHVMDIGTKSSKTIMQGVSAGIVHIQFSSTDPNVFTYGNNDLINGRPQDNIFMGRIDTLAFGALQNWPTPEQNYYLQFWTLAHTFFDSIGTFWAIGLGNRDSYLNVQLSNPPNLSSPIWVSGIQQYPIAPTQWQFHSNRTNEPNWFVGDGANTVFDITYGLPFIQVVHVDPATKTIQNYNVASVAQNYSDAWTQPNARWLNYDQSVSWNDTVDLFGNSNRRVNVFFTKIQQSLQDKKLSSTITGFVDGIFTEANGTKALKGWACLQNYGEAIQVSVLVGGPAGVGKQIAKVNANVTSEIGVDVACKSSGFPHRFQISLAGLGQHRGKKIYVYGMYPSRFAAAPPNLLLPNSGQFAMP